MRACAAKHANPNLPLSAVHYVHNVVKSLLIADLIGREAPEGASSDGVKACSHVAEALEWTTEDGAVNREEDRGIGEFVDRGVVGMGVEANCLGHGFLCR